MADQSFPQPTDAHQFEALAELAAAYAPHQLAAPNRIRFTEQAIARIVPRPDGKQFCVWDVSRPGFGLRVSGRVKSFVFVYRHAGRSRWLTLGRSPLLSLADAVALCRLRYADVCYGRDPASERQQQRDSASFQVLCDRYLEWAERNKRASSFYEDKRNLNKTLLPRWQHRRAASITRPEVIELLEAVAARAPILANRILALCSKLFAFGVEREIIPTSPAIKLPKPSAEHQRDRVLGDDELRGVWLALDRESAESSAIYKLLVLTLARRNEVCGMRWDEVNLDAGGWWNLPKERTKTKAAHRLPLSPTALTILTELRQSAAPGEPFVFSGGRPVIDPTLARLRTAIGARFNVHDIRRSSATKLTQLGIDRLVVSKLLNHTDHEVTAIYDRHSYDDRKRAAVDRLDSYIVALIKGQPRSNIIQLHAIDAAQTA